MSTAFAFGLIAGTVWTMASCAIGYYIGIKTESRHWWGLLEKNREDEA